ncbi:hypothetical protein [Gracilibacillus kekensis]|uniref:Uncharacterized protein n=1 Tax=Gracilibacillus kekensis TaxID=1027249 RepID=A0A1M7L7X0_9BACI|nr:hypothetical protein [Gracilibacillus kekensis]SHM73893.1 hypothetical protein SAMN05216179_0969 [Gracilibacillus kekensis]
MTKEEIKRFARKIRTESQPIISSALVTGATRISDEMNHAVRGVHHSPTILLSRIATSLRNGAIAAGQEMMVSGVENVKKNRI